MTILIVCWGSYGDVYPYVGLALALKSLGYRPVLATAEFYRPLIESLGFELRPFGPQIDPNDRDIIARVLDPVRGADALIKELLMPSLRADYAAIDAAAHDAELIVTHPITFAAVVVAQARRLPWVSTVLAPTSFFSATDVPVLAPAPFLMHLGRLGAWYGHLIARIARTSTRAWMEPVFALRRDVGLPPGEHPLFEGQFSPTLTLALFSRVIGTPQPDWPPNVVVTGFVFYNGPEELPAELVEFLDAGPPPAVFTLGSSAVAVAGRFYEESIRAVERLGIRGVLLTGGLQQQLPRGRMPSGILLVDRAPHQLLFPRASVVVHQGGAGTLAQALRAGKPMLVVPHAHDQPDNAWRVTRLGVARTVRPRAYQGRQVAREIERLLRDSTVATRASELSAVVRSEGGAAFAAETIRAACGTLRPGNANDSRNISH